MVVKGHWCLTPLHQNLSIVDIRSRLSEIKFNVVSEHLEDDPDELAGTVPEGIVMSPAFRHLGIVISLEGGVVLNHVVCSVHQSVAKDLL